MFCDPWESLAHGFILIWDVRNFLLDDFSNSDLEVNKLELLRCHLLHLPAPITFRLLLKLGTT